MTKKIKEERNLVWKLGDLPTATEISNLVYSEVISKEEAREIMFGSAESNKDHIKALEDQVELLLKVVDSLSRNKPQVISIPYSYTPNKPYWEKYWMNTVTNLSDSGLSFKSLAVNNTMTVNTENLLKSNLN